MKMLVAGLLACLFLSSPSFAATPEKEITCLAQAIYYEARGEPERGRLAVAQVILNRANRPGYPETICGVVFQNKNRKNRCQFSFACDGNKDTPKAGEIWDRSKAEAKSLYECDADCRASKSKRWREPVWSSTHFHATYANPNWAKDFQRTEKIGQHIFYRDA
jgi:spore germination cell wall hydrolase CwlJ-like protein